MDLPFSFKQLGPMIGDMLDSVRKAWKTDSPPPNPMPEPAPAPGPAPGPMPATTPDDKNAHESEAIRGLQKLLNVIPGIAPTPPLDEDGWLGPKTEKVILDAISLARSYGFG